VYLPDLRVRVSWQQLFRRRLTIGLCNSCHSSFAVAGFAKHRRSIDVHMSRLLHTEDVNYLKRTLTIGLTNCREMLRDQSVARPTPAAAAAVWRYRHEPLPCAVWRVSLIVLRSLVRALGKNALFRRHRCPHKPFGKIDGPCLITEYHEQYKKKVATFAESFKPKYEPMVHGEPMQGTTTFR